MDKKYGDKYGALRAAAAAKQRKRNSGSGSSSHPSTSKAVASSKVSKADDAATYQRLQALKQQQQQQQQQQSREQQRQQKKANTRGGNARLAGGARIVSDGNGSTSSGVRSNDKSSASGGGSGGSRVKMEEQTGSVHGSRGSNPTAAFVARKESSENGGTKKYDSRASSSLPPRRPPAANAAPSSSTQHQKTSDTKSSDVSAVNSTSLVTPVRRAASSANLSGGNDDDRYTTPNSTAFQLGGGDSDYDYNYNDESANDGGNHGSDAGRNDVDGNPSPPPPKTPLTTMRDVMSSISRDRTEIEGARRVHLFDSDEQDHLESNENNDGPVNTGTRGAASEWDGDIVGDGNYVDPEPTAADDIDDLYEQRRFNSSSCLPYGSEIILRFRNAQILTSLSVQPRASTPSYAIAGESRSRSRVCFVANEAHGRLGGINQSGENRFVLVRDVVSGGSSSLGRLSEEEEGTEDPEEEDLSRLFLCYGDKVTLRSGVVKRVLGVQKEKTPSANKGNDGGKQVFRLEVGCFRREGRFPQANRWTVLRGGANAPMVQLGSSTAASAAAGEREKRRIPVYSGDPVVLRNDWTGGLLSLGKECRPTGMDADGAVDDVAAGWSLNVLTSSYQMNDDGAASTEDDRPLVEYLHEHDRCRPRRTETFQIIATDVPHCPDWAYPTGEGSDRIYLEGTYLSRPDRHDDLIPEMEAEVFPEARTHNDVLSQGWPFLAALSVDVQERVLLDEVIGAMMGQEGHFLRFQQEEEVEVEESEGNDEYVIAAEPTFVFATASILGGKIDSSLENILSRILPLCTHYVYVNQYVQSCLNQYECGVIARTLSEAMNKLLETYLAFVADLDYLSRETLTENGRGGLTMSMLHVHAQPSIRTMAIMAQVTSAVQGKKGGELLNSLYNLMSLNYSGDENANELLQHLLAKCATPYANMLCSWLMQGKVHDPHGEFMIEVIDKTFRENHVTIKQGMEWADWCREKEDHVLWSLHDLNDMNISMSLAVGELGVDRSRATSHMSALHKAHATGKFWRAIHCCREGAAVSVQLQDEGKKASLKEGSNVLLNPLKLSRCIDRAYHEASDTLLRMLLDEYGLLSSLRFMKKYFLLDQGDFFVDFLDGAEDELHKELPNVLQGRVQNWLSTSIARTSESSYLATALRCTFQNKSLRETLDDLGRRNPRKSAHKKSSTHRQKVLAGFEAIAFEFKSVPFPTSIVLSHSQLRIYQLIFRLIFFAKYVERQLVGMWLDHQLLKVMTSLRSACSPTFSLRRRMLHFIQNFVYYMKFDVIEPNWRELENKLNATKEYCSNKSTKEGNNNANGQFPRTVDDLLHEHNQFLLRISNQCLLPNYDLIERASKIMTTCLLFSTQIKRFMETTKVHELHEKTRLERSKLRYSGKKSKNGDQELEFRANREERTGRCSDRILGELCTETYRHMITRFDEVFSAHLAEFMKNLNSDFGQKSNAHLTNLSMQLDYNGFVSSSIYAKE